MDPKPGGIEGTVNGDESAGCCKVAGGRFCDGGGAAWAGLEMTTGGITGAEDEVGNVLELFPGLV
jgi:hypothetical protein